MSVHVAVADVRHRQTGSARHRRRMGTGPGARVARIVVAGLARLSGAVLVAVAVSAFAMLAGPRIVGWQMYVVSSDSMGAATPIGSAVLLRPVPPPLVQVGDILLLDHGRPGGTPMVLHRVVSRGEASGVVVVRTKGDANAAVDPGSYPVRGSAYTVAQAIPWLGYAIVAIKSPVGYALLSGLVALFLTQVVNSSRRRRETLLGAAR